MHNLGGTVVKGAGEGSLGGRGLGETPEPLPPQDPGAPSPSGRSEGRSWGVG